MLLRYISENVTGYSYCMYVDMPHCFTMLRTIVY